MADKFDVLQDLDDEDLESFIWLMGETAKRPGWRGKLSQTAKDKAIEEKERRTIRKNRE